VTIAATDDPGIYQFANLQTEDICVTPQGEIEVSMGQMLRPASEAFDIDDFDFTSFLAHIQSEAAEASPQLYHRRAYPLSLISFPPNTPQTS